MPDIIFDVVRESESWPDEVALEIFAARVALALEGHAKGHITYAFTDDEAVQVLNRAWRGKDKPTNVLSFPDGDADETGVTHLGDVVLAHETLVREALEMGIAFEDHLTHLLLHGSLHLLGHDHETESEANTMESLEIELLAGMGIKNPYQP